MYYYFNGFKVDVFGYDEETEQFDYCVESWYSSKCRKAKKHYKQPNKRDPWAFPYGTYIYIIDHQNKRHKLWLVD